MNPNILALQISLLLVVTSVTEAQMVYNTAAPLLDFATITDSDGGGRIGTISMIDGHQKAYIDGGHVVSGTGRFEYKATVRDGLYMDFTFDLDGGQAHGGLRVSDMIVEYRFDGTGPNALQYVYIHRLKLANNRFAFSLLAGKGQPVTSGATTVTETSLVDGRLRFRLADLNGSQKDQWFAARLVQNPLSGELRCGIPPKTLTSTNAVSDTETSYPFGRTAATAKNDAVAAATKAARDAVLADLRKQAAGVSCAEKCSIGKCTSLVGSPVPVVNSPAVTAVEHLFGQYVTYTATVKVVGTIVVECQCN